MKYIDTLLQLARLGAPGVLGVIIVFLYAPASNSAARGWLAYGDLRGNLQPCGCDPQTDLGGVRRIGTLVARERRSAEDIVVFDLGNNFHQPLELNLAGRFLNQALDELAPDAALLRSEDLGYAKQYVPKRAVVLSNARQAGDGSWQGVAFREVVVSKGAVVLGYTWHAESKDLRPWGSELRAHWQRLRAGHGGKPAYLLFSGPREHLQGIAEAELFTAIIAASSQGPERTFAEEEREHEERLLPLGGRWPVYSVPVGGAGLLRGGSLLTSAAPSLNQLLSQNQTPAKFHDQTPRTFTPLVKMVTWLSREYDDGSPLEKTLAKYEHEEAAAFKSREGDRRNQLADTHFVGAEACRSCHSQAYEVWSKSKHADAYHTLEKAGKSENATCVTCHVLGFKEAGGFVSAQGSPQFKHVQCENCHGPRKHHLANPSKNKGEKGAAFNACPTCHNDVHSPKFHQEQYWLRIKH